jgi:hypothetical protein
MMPATDRKVWCVGRKPLSDRKLQNEANLGSTPECPPEPPLGPPFLLIIRMIFASLVIRL